MARVIRGKSEHIKDSLTLKYQQMNAATIAGDINSQDNAYLQSNYNFVSKVHDKGMDEVIETQEYVQTVKNVVSELREQLGQNTQQRIPLMECPGFCVFQEYFFYPGNANEKPVVPSGKAREITNLFSSIAPKMIWMCNFLASDNEGIQNREKIDRCIQKFGDKQRCTTSIKCKDLTRNPPTFFSNQTYFGLDGRVVAMYKKSTYYTENEQFLRAKKGLYEFGEWEIESTGEGPTDLIEKIRKTMQPFICADYGHVKEYRGVSKKFLILQSMTYKTAFDELMRYDKSLQKEPNRVSFVGCRKQYVEVVNDKLPRVYFPYLIHCSPQFIANDFNETKFYSVIKNERIICNEDKEECYILDAEYAAAQAQKPVAASVFKLGVFPTRIEIFEIRD